MGERDANHADVAGWYEELMCQVFDTHILGKGFGDMVVRIPTRMGGIVQIVEVKTEDGVLSLSQERFIGEWGRGCVAIVRTREDVHVHVDRVRMAFK